MDRCLPPAAIASGRSDPSREGLAPSRETVPSHGTPIRASRCCALVWGFPSQAVFSDVSFFSLFLIFVGPFLGSTAGPFLRPEHGARLFGSGGAIGSIAAGRIRSGARLPRRSLAFRSNLVFGTNPFRGSGTMMQSCASTAKLRRAGPFYKQRHKGHGRKRDTATPDRHRQRHARKRTRAE